MLLLLSPVSLVSFNANISQRFYVGNREIVILLVVCLHCALYIVLSQSILMLHHLQILKSPFHVLPELLLRYTTFIGIDCKAHQKKNTYTKAEERALSAPACSLLTTSVYLQDYSAEDQEILFDILNDRYRYKSVIVTSQKSPDQWVKDLGGTTIAEAIVERLANNNFDLVLEGKSLRTSLTLPDSK